MTARRIAALGGAFVMAAALVLSGLRATARADELPAFRAGLWEFDRTVESAGGGAGSQNKANQKCTNPTEDMRKGREGLSKAGCTFSPLARTGNAYAFTADCQIGGVKARSTSVITMESESAYTVKVESRQGAAQTRETLVAKRIGECPK